jgi:subtilisin family serine protease
MHTSAIRSIALVTGVVAIIFVSSASAWVSPSKSQSLEGLTGIRTSVHTSPAGNQVQTASLDHATYVEGEVLIKYRPTMTVTARKNLMVRLGVQEIRNISGLRVVHVKLPQGQSVEQALQVFAQDSAVEYVQPNFIYKAMAAPTDPLYGQQWGFRNTGQTIAGADWSVNNPGVSGSDLNIEQAWDHITDCSTVVVAVVDTGVNYLHQELAGNMWDGSAAGYPSHGFDFIGNGIPGDTDSDPLPQDVSGHGTHVAGYDRGGRQQWRCRQWCVLEGPHYGGPGFVEFRWDDRDRDGRCEFRRDPGRPRHQYESWRWRVRSDI